VDIDLAPDALLQLLEEKIFDIIIPGQVGREHEKRAAADQQNDNQRNNDTSSDHSCSLDRSSLPTVFMKLLLQARIRGYDEPSRRSALRHTAQVCLKASRLPVLVSLRVCALSRRTFMNNAALVGKPHHFREWVILPNHLY
jgi:hypothetical protein